MTSDNLWDPYLLDETYTSVSDVPCDTNDMDHNSNLRESISKEPTVLGNQGSVDKTLFNLYGLAIMKSSCRSMLLLTSRST